ECGSVTCFLKLSLEVTAVAASTRGISPMPACLTKLVTGNTTTSRDFLAFCDFRIVCAPLWREMSQRLGEAGQFKRGDCGRVPWFFDVAVDRFRRGKLFVNDHRLNARRIAFA